MLGEHGWHGTKWMYEETMQTPLIISTNLSKNIVHSANDLVQNLDLAPTILDYAQAIDIKNMQGKSLKPLLENFDSNVSWRNSVYYHHKEFPGEQMVAAHHGIRTKQNKIIHFYQFDEWEYYNLIDDPKEENNLYHNEDYQTEIKALKILLMENRKHYLDETNISIMPEEWRKKYRGPKARME